FVSGTPEEAPVGIDPLADEPSEAGDVPVSDEPGSGGEEPGAGGDEPAPASGGDEPIPASGGDEPAPSGGGDEPAPSGGDEPAPGVGGDEPAPGSSDDPPPSALPTTDITILQFLFGFFNLADPSTDEPAGEDGFVSLFLEGIGLETDTNYEGVHCYVRLGDSAPIWYPDTDGNQSTDESFLRLAGNQWNIADYLSEDEAVPTVWQGSEPVTAKVNCVATTGGGTVAVNLGTADITAPPEEWDGITRNVEASDEGWFRFAYRISQQEPIAKDLDPTIPVPFNVHIDDRRQELVWEWENTPDNAGAGVTGFMIFVNDTLVFIADDDGFRTRTARIPYSWFTPPCRTEYAFTVRAFRYPYPDGDYSDPSEAVILPNPDDPVRTDCQPEFIIEFTTLRTGNLPADGRPNNWAGLIGPITGSFYANGETTMFQGYDLLPNQTYNLAEMTWNSSGLYNHFIIEPTPGETFTVGFDLGQYIGWDGFNDICMSYFDEYDFNEMMTRGNMEGTLYSVEDDGQLCQVDYNIRHVPGTPLGYEDWLPLPWLDITGIRLDPATSEVILDVKNNGNAIWANHDLYIDFEGRETTSSYAHSERDFVLEVGETKTLRTSHTANNIWRYCFIIDPNNEVLELYENSNIMQHDSMRYCMPRPDLRLHDVEYNFDSNTLRMRVWNVGSYPNEVGNSDVNLADLVVGIDVPGTENDFNSPPGLFAGDILRRENGIWLEWALTPEQRAVMFDGYTVRLDPEDNITETDEDNNDFEVPGGKNIQLVWNGIYMRWYPDSILHECPNYGRWAGHDFEIWVDVYARSEYSNLHLESWHFEGETHGDDTWYLPDFGYGWNRENYASNFYVNGEESIIVEVRGEQERESLGSATGILEPERDWWITRDITTGGLCTPESGYGTTIHISPSNRGWGLMCGTWSIYVNTCEVFSP
ncbi:MAG: hypothetical protein ACK2T7_11595, partial [Anaerolineales bacterium]